jgi:hypothetical protein
MPEVALAPLGIYIPIPFFIIIMSSKKPPQSKAPAAKQKPAVKASVETPQDDLAMMPDVKKKSAPSNETPKAKPSVVPPAAPEKSVEEIQANGESVAATNKNFDASVASVLTGLADVPGIIAPPAAAAAIAEDTETTSASLDPELFDLTPSATAPTGMSLTFKLYGQGCLECAALVEDASEPARKQPCHFSKGNTHCPASSARIEFVGERITYLARIRKARANGDSNRVIRLMTELENKPLSFKNAVLAELGLIQPKPQE